MKCVDLKIVKTAQCEFELKNKICSLKVFKHDGKTFDLKFRVPRSFLALFNEVILSHLALFVGTSVNLNKGCFELQKGMEKVEN